MSSFDNKSINQPIAMLLVPDLGALAGAVNSAGFDVSNYDAGVTIILSTNAIVSGDTFIFEIETSNSFSSGYSVVPEEQLIGGAIPEIAGAVFNPGVGLVALSRGVIGAKKFIRVRISNINDSNGASAVAIINGATEVSPSAVAEGTAV